MKRYSLLAVAMVPIALACTEIQIEEQTHYLDGAIVGTFEKVFSIEATKAYFGSDRSFNWRADDQISVLLTNGERATFELCDGENTDRGTFTGSLGAGQSISSKIAYPKSAVTDLTSGSISMNYPASYSYGEPFSFGGTGDAALVLPCWANIVGNAFTMRHLGGYIVLEISEIPAGVDKFVFKATNGKRINGTFTADLSAAEPSFAEQAAATDVDKAITITFTASGTTTTRCFVIPVPTGEYSYEWRLYAGTAKKGFGEQNSAVSISRGQIYGKCLACADIGGGEEPEPELTIPNDEIWYTSSDGKIINIYNSVFGVSNSVKSNTYENGKGVIKFDGDVEFIGDSAFNRCTNLSSMIIPETATEIGLYAFAECSNLKSIQIPRSVTKINWWAFAKCSCLKSIIIPDSVTSIGSRAFWGCSGLTSINIPSSVTEIGQNAFIDCTGLSSVKIPGSVSKIEAGMFSGCTSLAAVVIPDSVSYIDYQAFYGCTNLKSATIGSCVMSIGGDAFGSCSSLTRIYCKCTTPPAIINSTFSDTHPDLKILVPRTSVDAYKTASAEWQLYAHLIEECDF